MAKIPKILLLVETSREYGRGILSGVARYSRVHGPWEFIVEPEFYISIKKKHFNPEEYSSIDGIIMRDFPDEQFLRKLEIPVISLVATQKRPAGIYTLDTDGAKISELAARHLMSKGFKNFAYIGLANIEWSVEREKSFMNFLSKYDYNIDTYSLKSTNKSFSWTSEHSKIAKWISSLPKPVAIMACNDDRGRDVIEACKVSRVKVPDEVAVIGVDNDFLLCEFCSPPLSSISLNLEKAGFEAAQLLDDLIKGKKRNPSPIIVEAKAVIPRLSTDVFAVSDKTVLAALNFIYDNCTKPIQVSDVADEVGMNRRSLNRKFKKALKKSVKHEMDQIRIEIISKYLLETDFSISQIGREMGFTGPDHISRFFKNHTEMSCLEYRKRYMGQSRI